MVVRVIILDFERIWPSVPYILEGVQTTLFYTSVSLGLGFLWGMLLALCKVSHLSFLKGFASFYTSIFRGTPLLLQLMLILLNISAPELMESIRDKWMLPFLLESRIL